MKRFNLHQLESGEWMGCGVQFDDGTTAFNKGTGEVRDLDFEATRHFWALLPDVQLEARWVD